MAVKAIYDKKEDIPENLVELYSERDGRFELTGIEGTKTQADVDRLNEALRKEREDHKKTKDQLGAFHEDTPETIEELKQKNERLEAQVAAGKGGEVDEAKLQEMAEGIAATKVAPVERELTRVKATNTKLEEENGTLKGEITRGKIETEVRAAAEKASVVPTAIEDAVLMAGSLFEVTDDGAIVMRDQVGYTPGITVADWLQGDMKGKRPHWWPASKGGGARGGGPGGGAEKNPWTNADWNVTEQGRIHREKGADEAKRLAEAAGTTLGGTKPRAKAA